MAGIPQRFSRVSSLARLMTRSLRCESLEDRSVPAILLDGIPTWVEQGPSPTQGSSLVSGMTGTPPNPVTGQVERVVAVPGNPNILFAGSSLGGLWRTTNALDGSPTWSPLGDYLPSMSISDVDMNPDNPNQLLIGVGASGPFPRGTVAGTSTVAISGDKIGAIYTTNALATNPEFRVLGGILANQDLTAVLARANYLFAAGTNGAFRSVDGGTTFTTVSGTGGLPAGQVFDAVADPASPNRVYVATASGLYKTDNIAATSPVWTDVTSPLMGFSSTTTTNAAIAIHNSTGNNIVYVGVVTSPNGLGVNNNRLSSVTWSSNQGSSWTSMDLPGNLGGASPVTTASNTGPIVITSANHGLNTGDQVYIQGVLGNDAANGVWTITSTGANTFTLNGSTGNGTHTAGTGTWQKIFGINPSGDGDVSFALTADPTNPNLIYIGGDNQNSTPNATGATTNNSANILRGDRSAQAQATNQPLSPQWSPIVYNFATGGSAPHSRTQSLTVDAGGDLIVGDLGGVYRRQTPTLSTGRWVSVVGNLGLGILTSVAQDTINGVVIAGNNNNGSTQQSASGSTLWNQVPNPYSVGTSLGARYQAVDNTSTKSSSLRYSMGANYTSFTRNTYDSTNSLAKSAKVMLADSSTPTVQFSGINAADVTFYTQGSGNVVESIPYVLNFIDPRMMMVGMTHLYEDNIPTDGPAGDIIVDSTPTGFTGQVTALAYGGYRGGIPYPRIAFVGNTNGDLFIRGETGNFTQVTSLPGTGAINDVVLNPSNWKDAYILRSNKIYRTTDGGLTFNDVTGNLVGSRFDLNGNVISGMTTALYSLAFWDPTIAGTDTDGVLLAGGNGGVFRRVPGVVDSTASGPWLEYGTALPNAVVYDLDIVGNRLVAGTLGRGAWLISDVSPTIGARAVVTVLGDSGDNNIVITPQSGNPNVIILNDGMGNTARIERTVAQEFRVNAGAGADRITITGAGTGSSLQFIQFPLYIEAGGNFGDTIIVQDTNRTTSSTVTVTANTIGSSASDTIFSASSATKVVYAGLERGTLVIDHGSTSTGVFTAYVQTTSANTTWLLGGVAADDFRINSNAGIGDNGSLDLIQGTVTIDGRSSGADTLLVSDLSTANGNPNVVISSNSINGLAGNANASPIYYSNVGLLTVTGSDSSNLPEVFTVINPSARLQLNTASGNDSVNIRANVAAVGVDAGPGNDLIRVSSAAGDNDNGDQRNIKAPVTVEGGAGDNQLVVSNFASAGGQPITVTSTAIGISGTPGITYYATGGRFANSNGFGLWIRGSDNAPDLINVGGTASNAQTVIDGNGGNDDFFITGAGLGGTVQIRGGEGDDNFTTDPATNGFAATSTSLAGGPGTNTLLVNGIANGNGISGDEIVGLTISSATTGFITGLGRGAGFSDFRNLTYDGRGGVNHLQYVDATGGGYGSPANPMGGIVYTPAAAAAGALTIAGGSIGPIVNFRNVNGGNTDGLVISGSSSGAGKDALTILGTSDSAVGSQYGEITTGNGSDVITLSQDGAIVRNQLLGQLRPVFFARTPDGLPSFNSVIVYAGNEKFQGDQVTVTPSLDTNLIVVGGSPNSKADGDTLTVNAAGTPTLTPTTDPSTGAAQLRADYSNGTGFTFRGFEQSSLLRSYTAIGADAGGAPRVKVIDSITKQTLFDRFVYNTSFRGGVRVATGDVNGDGIPDIVVGAGEGGGPHIQVFDGLTFNVIGSFFAYEASFTGGVYVSVGDVNGDGKGEIVVGSGNGGGPLVRVFNGQGQQLANFFAYEPSFRGGVRVAAGDVTGDGFADVVTGAGVGGAPVVRVFDGRSQNEVLSFVSQDPSARGGVFVAAGDMDGDGAAEVVAGPGSYTTAEIAIRRSRDGSLQRITVFDNGTSAANGNQTVTPSSSTTGANNSTVNTGIRVAIADVQSTTNKKQVLATRGAGFQGRIRGFVLDPVSESSNFLAFDPSYTAGVYVG